MPINSCGKNKQGNSEVEYLDAKFATAKKDQGMSILALNQAAVDRILQLNQIAQVLADDEEF